VIDSRNLPQIVSLWKRVTFLPFIDKKLIGKGFEFYSRTKGKELDVLFVEITFRNRSAPPTSGWMLGGGNAVIPTTCPPPGPLQMGERVNGYKVSVNDFE
jgi:hypothetical protein